MQDPTYHPHIKILLGQGVCWLDWIGFKSHATPSSKLDAVIIDVTRSRRRIHVGRFSSVEFE